MVYSKEQRDRVRSSAFRFLGNRDMPQFALAGAWAHKSTP